MVKLIDKDALVAEIERRIKSTNNDVKIGAIESLTVSKTLNSLISFINTLEVKEVDLQKEIDKEWEKCKPIDEGMGVESAFIHIEAFDMIVRHFFELGFKAKQG